ncbi:MAG: DEAD/DEAH box helicase [Deltaproteobacteria bacterium]|nr:DEAD/DEAH box helicase [Deltaproteobacteria bacterium]
MHDSTFSLVPAGLGAALQKRGFTSLTPIQEAVLAPELEGRDVRMSSQTGSGKTVALGFLVADLLAGHRPRSAGKRSKKKEPARPVVLMIAPTRELAMQLSDELGWLFASLKVEVGVVTGGRPIPGDLRLLERDPAVLVGTPGRLVDHLQRGRLDLSEVACVAIDEADELLDMGFAEELDALMESVPEERRTHLISATFPPTVKRLADRYQRDAARIEGTPAGAANTDISHRAFVLRPAQRLDALVNLLLLAPEEKTLIFVRTRADAARVSAELAELGFHARGLSGDLGQRERTATLEGFRGRAVSTLVATDVAARGLDVPDVARVVHHDLPENADVLTHRSGRTGRAGKQGVSLAFVAPSSRRKLDRLYHEAGIAFEYADVPGVEAVKEAAHARLRASLGGTEAEAATVALAAELLEGAEPIALVASLLERMGPDGPCHPRAIQQEEWRRPERKGRHERQERPERKRGPGPGRADKHEADYVPFQVSLGRQGGADVARLLAIVCRRGKVTRDEIGAIKLGPRSSRVEVIAHAAAEFEKAAGKIDQRDPRVKIRRWKA